MKHKSLVLLVVSFLGVSCSHIAEKQKVVKFPYEESLLTSIQEKEMMRTPLLTPETEEKDDTKSARRVYFSALYYQYLTLGKHLGKPSEINSCPQFHHDKVETDSSALPEVLMFKASHIQKEGRGYFPELAFNKNFSLGDHHEGMKDELDVLCDEGVSDNFYKFDNLVTHYAAKKSFHQNRKSMEAVLKIPVFANFYLVKMLQGTSLKKQAIHPDESRFIKMTKTLWFDQYVNTASALRGDYIKTKMVQR